MNEAEFNRALYSVLIAGGLIMAFGSVLIVLFMRALSRTDDKEKNPAAAQQSRFLMALIIGMILVLCIVLAFIAYQRS